MNTDRHSRISPSDASIPHWLYDGHRGRKKSRPVATETGRAGRRFRLYEEWEKLLADIKPLNVLFVCSRNQWRSPTGEAVFRNMDGVATRSAGTSHNARRKLSLSDIRWADLILVMEEKHASRIRADFRQEVRHKALHVLDIPDDYRFMDEELVELFHEAAGPIIGITDAD